VENGKNERLVISSGWERGAEPGEGVKVAGAALPFYDEDFRRFP